MFSYTIWIVLIPFFVFLLVGFFGNRFKPMVSGIVGSAGLLTSWILSIVTALLYFFDVGKVDGVYQQIIGFNIEWLRFTDTLVINMGVLIDPISVMMMFVVTTVSLMAHIYSTGYMKGEKGFERFYAFLSLFTFAMLGLVVATNIFQMYIFWELVGVSSYLLIGFYYKRPSAVAASKKAFIVTRFADLGFLVGILLISYYTGTFDFLALTSASGPAIATPPAATFMGMSVLTWALILIFMGGAGKSAMFPLHIWLPDAMEGPTPVSALIHAATMVVAGVYLVARMFPLYVLEPIALGVVAWVGAFSSLFAAIIACTQYDIKRVLAYSTMSQIGYMMCALGVSGMGGHEGLGYMASMFHLFTHAFFKALLFLCAGAIIHAVHSNYMQDMGGLRKYMPISHITFLVACLAISGIPPFSGFFSKDEILVAAYHHDITLFIIEYAVAGITAFYMFRLYFRIFWGKEQQYEHKPHEAPLSMTIPLIILGLGAIFAGFVPFADLVTSDQKPMDHHIDWALAIPSIVIGIIGIGVAWFMYMKPKNIAGNIAHALRGFYTAAYHKFYIDELYLFITKKIIFDNISRPIAWFDRHIVDGSMNGISYVTNQASDRIKGLQSGQLQQYALVFVSGAVILALVFIYLWT